MGKKIVLLFLFIGFLYGASASDSLRVHRLDSLTVTGSKATTFAGFASTTLDGQVIEAKATTSLGALLSENSSLFIRSAGAGSEQTASFRGTAPTHTRIIWNGIDVNSPMMGSADLSLVPVSFIDRLEVLPGLSSLQEAPGALGGVISASSRPDWDNRFGVALTQEAGSWQTYNTAVNVSAGSRRFQSSTKFYRNSSENDFPFTNRTVIDPQRPGWHPVQRNTQGQYLYQGLMQDFFVHLGGSRYAGLSVWGLSSDRNLPQLSTYEGGDNMNLTNQQDRSLRASAYYRSYGETVDFEAMAGFDLQQFGFTRQNRTAAGYARIIDSDGRTKSIVGRIGVTFRYSDKHTLALSTDATATNADTRESVRNQGYDKTRADLSQLVSLKSRWSGRFSTVAMLRGGFSGSSGTLSPAVGAEYALTGSLSLFGNVGINSHVPTLNDLYYIPGGNPDLKNETERTAEAGVSLTGSPDRSFRAYASLYYSDVSEWIVWLPSTSQFWSPDNVKRVKVYGLEAKAEKRFVRGRWDVYGMATFAITHSINNGDPVSWGDQSVGKQLVYIPVYSGNLFLSAGYSRFRMTYQFTCYSERYTTTSNEKLYRRDRLLPYFMNDAGLHYRLPLFKTTFDVGLAVNNLFDVEYQTVLQRPMPPRSFTLSLRWAL